MRRVVFVLGGALIGVAFLTTASMAQRTGPTKAKKFQSTLVTSYDVCVGPGNDTTAGALPLGACHPAVPADGQCSIDPGGGGKVQAKVDPSGDVALKVKLKGIVGCDGEVLQAQAGARVTTNNCNSADVDGCTVVDLIGFPITSPGNCTIANGQCQIKTTLNTELGPGVLVPGENTSIELAGAALSRVGGANDPGDVASAGLVIP